jgi:hypothetical protein
MKAVIKGLHPREDGNEYVVIFEDGREIKCATIDDAMKIKEAG